MDNINDKTEIKQNRLSKEYINSLPIIKFPGNISVISDLDSAEYAIDFLKNEELLGFDTESRPAFERGVSYPISLIQFSTSDKAFLFQINNTGFIDSLKDLLENNSIKKIGIGVDADKKKLLELSPNIKLEGFIDLKKIAEEKKIVQSGAKALSARYLLHRISKRAQKSNWARPVLNESQIMYAATDAWICLEIYPLLLQDNYKYIDELKIEQDEKRKREKEEKERQELLEL